MVARILVSIPDDLLAQVDREARARGMSRSRFLREAAQRQLGWPDSATLQAALSRGRDALTQAGAFDSAELVSDSRRGRDDRDRRR